ncbi:1,3-beta-glucanosyltransferase [Mortierella alpina]|nr:1,3-beta-glucanosyltransferase [Mortierella alpina]
MKTSIDEHLISKPMISVYFPPHRRRPNAEGEIVVAGIDTTRYIGDLNYVDIVNNTKPERWVIVLQTRKIMKIAFFVPIAAALLAFADGSPIKRLPSFSKNGQMGLTKVFAVSLSRNPHFKHHVKIQLAKINQRYRGITLPGGESSVPVVNFKRDREYYGTVSFGTPAQEFKVGSSDIWLASNDCSSCSNHTQFDWKKSLTYKEDGRRWGIAYADGSNARGILGGDILSVGGVSVRQTFGLVTEEYNLGEDPFDGMFGLGFNTLETVSGVKTFMDNDIAKGALNQPIFSVFLPSVRRNGGVGGEYLFGAIDSTKYTGDLTYVEVSEKRYWQIPMEGITYHGKSLGQAHDVIIDTGTSYAALSSDAAIAIHNNIKGADAVLGKSMLMWNLPCSLQNSTDNVGFTFGGKTFNIPMADIVIKNPDDGACFSGIYGRKDSDIGVLGDLFIKNNYCVFDQGTTPRIGLAPLRY